MLAKTYSTLERLTLRKEGRAKSSGVRTKLGNMLYRFDFHGGDNVNEVNSIFFFTLKFFTPEFWLYSIFLCY